MSNNQVSAEHTLVINMMAGQHSIPAWASSETNETECQPYRVNRFCAVDLLHVVQRCRKSLVAATATHFSDVGSSGGAPIDSDGFAALFYLLHAHISLTTSVPLCEQFRSSSGAVPEQNKAIFHSFQVNHTLAFYTATRHNL